MRAANTLVLLVLLLLFSGCAITQPSRGMVYKPDVGRRFQDFFFEDELGRSVSLGDSLGDFTILAFTRCDDNTHKQSSRFIQSIAEEHRQDTTVRVRGIDIHWTESDCSTHEKCHLLQVTSDTLSICDATGMIHRLYGVTKPNELFLIDPDRRVIGKATMAYPNSLRHQLTIDVVRFRGRLYETRSQDLGD